MGELAEIEAQLRRHDSALELGCGTGRLCGRMLELGLEVAGVDDSAEMLACMPAGAERIQSSIEELKLNRTWSAVLLPSHLINHPDGDTRSAFVRAARTHIRPTGTFYLQRHDAHWLQSVQDGPLGESFGFAMSAENVARQGDTVSMTLRYATHDGEWTQTFSTVALNEDQIEALLDRQGFAQVRWLGRRRLWAAAMPA